MSCTDPNTGRVWYLFPNRAVDFVATALHSRSYSDAIAAAGYDADLMKSMSHEQREEMCAIVGMRPGDKIRLLQQLDGLFREFTEWQSGLEQQAEQQAQAQAQAIEKFGACSRGGAHDWGRSTIPSFVRCSKCGKETPLAAIQINELLRTGR